MPQRLSLTALLVDEYDLAIAFFVGALVFELREDSDLGGGKRWVVVAPRSASRAVGASCSSKPTTSRDYRAYAERDVRFVEAPRHERYGSVTVFGDLYGNRWDLIQPAGVAR